MAGRAPAAGAGVRARGSAGGRVVSSCITGSSIAAACSPRSRLRSIPRRPWPRRVELHQRRPHHCRRLLASQQSSGRSHDARGRVVSSCVTGSSIAAACSPRSRAAVDSTTSMAASRRAASPAAPSPPPARLAAERRSILDAHGRDVSSCITGSSIAAACSPRSRLRSIPRRPWPRRVELHQRRPHHCRRLLASQQSSGRSHDARGRVVSSCVTGSSIAAACSPRSRAAVDSTTSMAASRRAASPAAPSPPPARLAAERRSILDAHGRDVSGCITGSSIAPPARLAVERRSIPRRPRPRRVELHHRQLHRRRLLASQQAAVDPTTPMAASRRAASTAAPSLPPPARLAAEQRSIPRRPRPRRVELRHRQLHRRRLLASQQGSGRFHDVHGRIATSCITGSSIAAACSPRSRAAVDP